MVVRPKAVAAANRSASSSIALRLGVRPAGTAAEALGHLAKLHTGSDELGSGPDR